MTHEQYISLETARLAKQAGFDWECAARYHEQQFLPPIRTCIDWNNGIFPSSISAPTQAVLQRWLRETKDMLVLIDFESGSTNFQYLITSYSEPNAATAKVGGWYQTIEAALEAGLQTCLTLLFEKK